MAREIVLLSDRPLDAEVAHKALVRVLPEAVAFRLGDFGLTMHVDQGRSLVVSVCESVPVEVPGAGTELLVDPIAHYRYWTDIAIPEHSHASMAGDAVKVMARAVDGHLSEKK